ncbi:MAG: hypothetical protein V3V05_04430 [Pontiella sp.]
MKRIFYILIFILWFLFYWNTGQSIENRTDAEDIYEYALMVEEGAEHPWFYHQHHLLYGSSMRLCYSTAQLFGYNGRAIDIMRLVSALAAAGTLFLFFLFCYKRFSLRPVSSLLATAFLGMTYGFWRYSAESEIPLTASVVMVAALFFATDPGARKRSFILAILFSVLSVLMHVMNLVAVFAAIPCFYLLQKRWKKAGWYLAITAGIVFGIYGLITHAGQLHTAGVSPLRSVGFGPFVKAAVAFCQCVISCDFMLGFTSVRAFLGELFKSRMLLEEFYLGERLPRLHVLLSTLTFIASFMLATACLLRAGWVWKNIIADRKRFQLPDGIPALVVAGIFISGYAGLLLFIEPGNPELWVMGLVPFSLLFCGLVLLPLTFDNRLWLPFCMILLLFIHNAGAMRVLKNPKLDYQQQKAKTVLELASDDDVIITAGNPVFERYLRYHFEGEVLYLHKHSAEELENLPELESIGTIYVLGDVFNQPASLRIRFPEKTSQIAVYASKLEPHIELVFPDEFGGVWKLQRNARED